MNAKVEYLALLEEKLRRKRRRKFFEWFPDTGPRRRELYPKHVEAIRLSKTKPYVMMFGGNGTGKTEFGAFWVTAHATGEYPDWWPGHEFDRTTWGYAATETWTDVEKRAQFKLLGPSDDIGTGMIPGDLIVNLGNKIAGTNTHQYVDVRHVSGGLSRIEFQCFARGREGFQGTERDWGWCDEEDKTQGASIFAEIVQRFRGRSADGLYLHTMTSLYGWTELATMFVPGRHPSISAEEYERSGRAFVAVAQDEVPHMTEEDRERKLANAEQHLKESRKSGMPGIGTGNVYQIPVELFTVPTRQIPAGWRKVWIMDPGFNDPTAVLWIAQDPETGISELYSEHYVARAETVIHTAAIKARGAWIPGLADTSSKRVSELMGEHTLLREYQQQGLDIDVVAKPEIAASIQMVSDALSTGQLKVQKHLQRWFFEYSMYRFDEKGKLVQGNDHLMDCTRYYIAGGGIARARSAPLPSAPRVKEQRFC